MNTWMAVRLQDVDRLGIGRVMELALEALGVSGKEDGGVEAPLHLSFDIDSVDPKVCSTAGYAFRVEATCAWFFVRDIVQIFPRGSLWVVRVRPKINISKIRCCVVRVAPFWIALV